MKTKTILLTAAIICLSYASRAQFAFGVSPGLSLNSAYFGYKLDRFVPFIGFQYAGASANYESEYETFDFDVNDFVMVNETAELNFNLFVPNVGVKYFIKEMGDLKMHTTLNISKPIASGKVTYDNEVDTEVEDLVEGLSVWGGELSFGMEYFLSEHFSLGGEFGLRYLHVTSENIFEREIFNPNTGEFKNSFETTTVKLNANPTFSRISFNFYI
jgi:hypothetical protein